MSEVAAPLLIANNSWLSISTYAFNILIDFLHLHVCKCFSVKGMESLDENMNGIFHYFSTA